MSKRTKTKPDATPASALTVAEDYPAVAPVIEREFKRIFPTLTLLNFGRRRGGYQWINLSGTETELLRLGIVESSMIPVRPKRLVYFSRSCWSVIVKRHARDRLSVRMDLDDTLDRAHPLAPLASYNWQALVEQSESPPGPDTAPSYPMADFCTSMLDMIMQCARGDHPSWPEALPTETQRRIERHVDAIREELPHGGSKRTAARPSFLKLVVDNTVRP